MAAPAGSNHFIARAVPLAPVDWLTGNPLPVLGLAHLAADVLVRLLHVAAGARDHGACGGGRAYVAGSAGRGPTRRRPPAGA
ncbi:MAG: hypothetical protein IT179_18150 [Acidobacteria bacterium]|nr:hypothetical protein [Acidobacteriota bacterium]